MILLSDKETMMDSSKTNSSTDGNSELKAINPVEVQENDFWASLHEWNLVTMAEFYGVDLDSKAKKIS